MTRIILTIFLAATAIFSHLNCKAQSWPDGTPMDAWFSDTSRVALSSLGPRYVITDYGVSNDSTLVQTRQIQAVIDSVAGNGGGQVVIPRGTFLSGSLYFRQGTHLVLDEGARLKGSDRIEDFDIRETRIEGETCLYYTALVNADGLDGFVIAGPGTIDGNGHHYWRQFWLRREWNPQCTNKDEQRPRLVYISNSQNVTVQDVHLQNSPFWTNHLYKSHHVRYLGCRIYSPTSGLKAPSSDALDIDACHDVLMSGCYMNVNDDAVVLKGGKGTYADQDPRNGANWNILIKNCDFAVVHSCLTLGSECIDNQNVILRDCRASGSLAVLWLKMRPDTPQHNRHVLVENISGQTGSFLLIHPWTQFYNKTARPDMPLSSSHDIVLRHIEADCANFFDVETSDQYSLHDFTFEDINVTDKANAFDAALIKNTSVNNMIINGVQQKNL